MTIMEIAVRGLAVLHRHSLSLSLHRLAKCAHTHTRTETYTVEELSFCYFHRGGVGIVDLLASKFPLVSARRVDSHQAKLRKAVQQNGTN